MRYLWIGIIVIFSFASCAEDENLSFDLPSEGLAVKWELYQYEVSEGSNFQNGL